MESFCERKRKVAYNVGLFFKYDEVRRLLQSGDEEEIMIAL